MIRVAVSAFASMVASRYAAAAKRRPRVGRVLLQLGRRAAPLSRTRVPRATLTLRVAHRMTVEDSTSVRLSRTQTLVQRVEHHVTATRHMLERTQRVEQVPLQSGALPRLLPGASQHAAAAATLPVMVPPLPRVLRRPAAAPAPAEPARSLESASSRKHSVSALPAIDVARLTDEVMRGIDRRLAAWRERRGRV